MLRRGLWLTLLLTGCSTVSQTGSLKKIEPFHHRCEEENEKASVVLDGELLKFDVRAYGTCRDGETRTFTSERYNESWLLAGSVGTVVGALIEVPLVIGIAWFARQATTGLGDLGDAVWLLLLPGLGAGISVAAAIGKTSVRLADGPDEQIVEVTSSSSGQLSSEGLLVVEEEPSLRWKLAHGKASIKIERLWRHDLTRLLVNGILLDYDEPARELIDRLGACRRALDRWVPGAEGSCVQERRRRDDALGCHAAGFAYADAVLARMTELGCQPR